MPKTIKELPEHSRPREKLRERGATALTDEELVAVILGMGTSNVDVRTMGLLDWNRNGIYFAGLQKTASHLFRVDPVSAKIIRSLTGS